MTEFEGGSAQPAIEVLSSENGALQPGEPARQAGSRRTGLIAGVLTVALLAAAGGAYAAYSAFDGSGAQPEEVVPASTFAFAKVDLDPSAGQKLALYNLLQKFQGTSELKASDKDFGEWLTRRIVESDSSATGIDYSRDIKPWLGKRFAVAGLPGATAAEPVEGLLVLQETDEKAATAGLEKMRRSAGGTKFDYAFMDGYVVIAPDSTTAAHAAVKAAATSSLAHASTYQKDVASLGSDEVITAWANADAVGKLVKKAAASELGAGTGGASDGLGWLVDSAYKGRWVLGLHAADNSVELQVKSTGGKPGAVAPPLAHLDNVVDGAWGVIAFGGLGKTLDERWKTLAGLPTYREMATQLTEQLGLRLPQDLDTLLGSELEVSISGDLTKAPNILAASTTKDPAAAKALFERLLERAGAPAGVVTDGVRLPSTFYVGSSDTSLAGPGKGMDANPLFVQAVANPKTAQAIGFVDLTHVWSTMGAELTGSAKEWQHLVAIGFSGYQHSSEGSLTVRFVLH